MLFYGLAPPLREATAERADEMARVTIDRLTPLGLDALILYNADAESDRSEQDRLFRFAPMTDPELRGLEPLTPSMPSTHRPTQSA